MKISNPFKGAESQSLTVGLSFPGAPSVSWTATFKNADRLAAWELYIEVTTTIITQPLEKYEGNEQAALKSLHSMFATTRDVLRRHGPSAYECSKVAITMLNQAIRPFTTKWHTKSLSGAFENDLKRQEFRTELAYLQCHLQNYVAQLKKISGVDDNLTDAAQRGMYAPDSTT